MHPRAHRVLSHLALAAILSLASLPTLGRLVLPAHPMSHAMPMNAHAMPGMPGQGPERAPAPHDHGEDCAYCVLLSGALPTAALSLVVANPPPTQFVALERASAPLAGDVHPGLGARGPPLDA
jgi:hypothetical protein